MAQAKRIGEVLNCDIQFIIIAPVVVGKAIGRVYGPIESIFNVVVPDRGSTAERTLLARIRTGLTIMGFGFVVALRSLPECACCRAHAIDCFGRVSHRALCCCAAPAVPAPTVKASSSTALVEIRRYCNKRERIKPSCTRDSTTTIAVTRPDCDTRCSCHIRLWQRRQSGLTRIYRAWNLRNPDANVGARALIKRVSLRQAVTGAAWLSRKQIRTGLEASCSRYFCFPPNAQVATCRGRLDSVA